MDSGIKGKFSNFSTSYPIPSFAIPESDGSDNLNITKKKSERLTRNSRLSQQSFIGTNKQPNQLTHNQMRKQFQSGVYMPRANDNTKPAHLIDSGGSLTSNMLIGSHLKSAVCGEYKETCSSSSSLCVPKKKQSHKKERPKEFPKELYSHESFDSRSYTSQNLDKTINLGDIFIDKPADKQLSGSYSKTFGLSDKISHFNSLSCNKSSNNDIIHENDVTSTWKMTSMTRSPKKNEVVLRPRGRRFVRKTTKKHVYGSLKHTIIPMEPTLSLIENFSPKSKPLESSIEKRNTDSILRHHKGTQGTRRQPGQWREAQTLDSKPLKYNRTRNRGSYRHHRPDHRPDIGKNQGHSCNGKDRRYSGNEGQVEQIGHQIQDHRPEVDKSPDLKLSQDLITDVEKKPDVKLSQDLRPDVDKYPDVKLSQDQVSCLIEQRSTIQSQNYIYSVSNQKASHIPRAGEVPLKVLCSYKSTETLPDLISLSIEESPRSAVYFGKNLCNNGHKELTDRMSNVMYCAGSDNLKYNNNTIERIDLKEHTVTTPNTKQKNYVDDLNEISCQISNNALSFDNDEVLHESCVENKLDIEKCFPMPKSHIGTAMVIDKPWKELGGEEIVSDAMIPVLVHQPGSNIDNTMNKILPTKTQLPGCQLLNQVHSNLAQSNSLTRDMPSYQVFPPDSGIGCKPPLSLNSPVKCSSSVDNTDEDYCIEFSSSPCISPVPAEKCHGDFCGRTDFLVHCCQPRMTSPPGIFSAVPAFSADPPRESKNISPWNVHVESSNYFQCEKAEVFKPGQGEMSNDVKTRSSLPYDNHETGPAQFMQRVPSTPVNICVSREATETIPKIVAPKWPTPTMEHKASGRFHKTKRRDNWQDKHEKRNRTVNTMQNCNIGNYSSGHFSPNMISQSDPKGVVDQVEDTPNWNMSVTPSKVLQKLNINESSYQAKDNNSFGPSDTEIITPNTPTGGKRRRDSLPEEMLVHCQQGEKQKRDKIYPFAGSPVSPLTRNNECLSLDSKKRRPAFNKGTSKFHARQSAFLDSVKYLGVQGSMKNHVERNPHKPLYFSPQEDRSTIKQALKPRRNSYPNLATLNNTDQIASLSNMSWKKKFQQRYAGVKCLPYIDTHCHLDFLFERSNYKGTFEDYQAENKDTFPINFGGCVTVFCNPRSFSKNGPWKKILESDNVYGAVGCHPKNAPHFTVEMLENMIVMLHHSKIIALGEIGLDYSGTFFQHAEEQQQVFRRQLQLALNLKKRLVIHCRDAEEDCINILEEVIPSDYLIHRHCFTGTWEQAKTWLDKFPNSYIGLTPVITWRNMKGFNARRVAAQISLDRLILETDAPYFVPNEIPRNEMKFSHPGMAITVASEVAELQGVSMGTVLAATRNNTLKMYGI